MVLRILPKRDRSVRMSTWEERSIQVQGKHPARCDVSLAAFREAGPFRAQAEVGWRVLRLAHEKLLPFLRRVRGSIGCGTDSNVGKSIGQTRLLLLRMVAENQRICVLLDRQRLRLVEQLTVRGRGELSQCRFKNGAYLCVQPLVFTGRVDSGSVWHAACSKSDALAHVHSVRCMEALKIARSDL
mmetsp:Transcript_7527/g.26863  ORF Transcript_7527/g.26863 Transcript_7527/m.26863 type:complete len:185 (-) Transcript_7527:519-1073(-)